MAVPGEKRRAEQDQLRPVHLSPAGSMLGASGALVNEAARPLQCAGRAPAPRLCDLLEDKIIAPCGGTKTSVGFVHLRASFTSLPGREPGAHRAQRQACGERLCSAGWFTELGALRSGHWHLPQSCPRSRDSCIRLCFSVTKRFINPQRSRKNPTDVIYTG